MEKTATLNLRVDPVLKRRAEAVLDQLGVPMSTAIDMYLSQICLTGSIPFSVALPKAPASVNADLMTDAQLHQALRSGIDAANDAVEAGRAFADFRDKNR